MNAQTAKKKRLDVPYEEMDLYIHLNKLNDLDRHRIAFQIKQQKKGA